MNKLTLKDCRKERELCLQAWTKTVMVYGDSRVALPVVTSYTLVVAVARRSRTVLVVGKQIPVMVRRVWYDCFLTPVLLYER